MQKPHLKVVRLPEFLRDASAVGDEEAEEGWDAMDLWMWSRLPDDVLERVLGLLPAGSVCRFRTVCRGWRSLLLHPRAQSRLAACSNPAISLMCTFEDAGADFQGRPVHRLDLSFLPLRYRKYWHTRYRFREGQDVFASHGGLVCITDGKKTPHTAGLCVFNPVTRAWRELPAMAAILPEGATGGVDWQWSLDLRSFSAGFEVTVLCRTEGLVVATTAVFSSQAGAWRIEHDHCGLLLYSDKASILVHRGMFDRPEWHYLLLQEQKIVLLHCTVGGEPVGEPRPVKGGWIWDSRGAWDCVSVDALVDTGEFYLVSLKSGIWKLDQRTLCLQLVSALPDALRRRVFKPGQDCKLARAVHMDGALILVISVHARFFATGPCICQHYLVFSVAKGTWHYAAFCESFRPIVLGLIKPSLATIS